MSKPEFVYVIYIASTPEKVFEALTDAKMSERYWHGNYVEFDWKVGSPFTLRLKRHDKNVTGEVLEDDPPRRLAYTFHSAQEGHESEKHSRVTFELERQKDQVKLTVVHDKFEPGSKVLEGSASAGRWFCQASRASSRTVRCCARPGTKRKSRKQAREPGDA